jgi:hypothetical protein
MGVGEFAVDGNVGALANSEAAVGDENGHHRLNSPLTCRSAAALSSVGAITSWQFQRGKHLRG